MDCEGKQKVSSRRRDLPLLSFFRSTHHRFLSHQPLRNLRLGIRSNRSSVHRPSRNSSNLPGDESRVSIGLVGVVLDSVGVEVPTVGLGGVDVGESGDGLNVSKREGEKGRRV